MKVKDKKLIVNIRGKDLELLEEAGEIENRNRNNFIIHSALEKAKKIINGKKEEEVLTN